MENEKTTQLHFNRISLDDRKLIGQLLLKYSRGSCQYALPQMIGLQEKYGDEYYLVDDILIIHRSKKDTDSKRVYLAPLGAKALEDRTYVKMIMEDAKSYGKVVSFEPVVKEFVDKLNEWYPEAFEIIEDRDMAEYVYTSQKLVDLSGKKLAAKRNRINAFWSTYSNDSVRIEDIGPENMAQVYEYQRSWLAERNSYEADQRLDIENDAINYYLDHFEELGFFGRIVYLNERVVGYAAGMALSEDTADEVIEKGDTEITGIYQLLCQEFAKQCLGRFTYVNREEDIGIPGLRRAKESYRPEFLIEKYVAREV